ncbi:MAG: DUF1614 domain-containing protein [Chloroflexi bacterium]|nr:DUF1614 domain-containing protein [Chloroflexota bacterium]
MSLLILILFALLIPLLLLVLFYRLVTVSFVRLGIPPRLVAALFIGILVGGLVNIPVWGVADATRGPLFSAGHFFFLQPPAVATTIVAVNVGGAIIPILMCLWMMPRTPLFRTMLAITVVTIVAFSMAEVVPGKGIALNALVPPGVSAIISMILAWRRAAPVAYISGVLGTLVGADLLHLPEAIRGGGTYLSIGGAGIFDGIFLIGIFAAFLSPGARKRRETEEQDADVP